MQNTVSALIDRSALSHNLQLVRALCPGSRIMAMIKSDAYGHGALPAAGALAAADGFAVARLKEARQLREAGVTHRLLLLGTLLEQQELVWCSEQNVDVTAHDERSVEAIADCARVRPMRVWLKLDCGMHRLGLDESAFVEAGRLLAAQPGISELVHMTHFSSTRDMAGATMAHQAGQFAAAHAADPGHAVSAANSAVLLARPDLRGDWVRPGIMLYGDNPLGASHPVALRPAMTLRARVIAVRSISAGESVGYDGRWTSARASEIATIGIGYGDGYPRHAANGTPVSINGEIAPLVGRVSMDSITVDVSDCSKSVAVGDEAILWGAEPTVSRVAECAGTASYELLTRVGGRVDREYVG